MGALVRMGAPTVLAAATLVMCTALAAPAHAAPRAEITGGPAGTVAASDGTFTFHATQQALFQGYDCHVDNAPWQRCDPPQHVEGMQPGPHSFEVRLLGLFVDQTPARREWQVAAPPPPPAPAPQPPGKPAQKPPAQPVDSGTQPPPAAASPAPTPSPPTGSSAPEPAPDPLAAGGCRNGAARAAQTSTRNLAAATLCLVNAERRHHDLPALRSHWRLRVAAARHASDMTARNYFAHDTPEGKTPGERIAAAGYLRGARSWSVGEVLHWASANRSSPSEALAGLLRSPAHRRILLSRLYRDIGIAVITAAPDGTAGGATYVMDLARRR